MMWGKLVGVYVRATVSYFRRPAHFSHTRARISWRFIIAAPISVIERVFPTAMPRACGKIRRVKPPPPLPMRVYACVFVWLCVFM